MKELLRFVTSYLVDDPDKVKIEIPQIDLPPVDFSQPPVIK